MGSRRPDDQGDCRTAWRRLGTLPTPALFPGRRPVRSELGNREVTRLFNVAESLHANFYEDQLQPFDISESLDDVERLLDLLEPLAHA